MLAISGGGQEPRALRRVEHLVSQALHFHVCFVFDCKRQLLKVLNRPQLMQRHSSNAP
jgi:hypothetical protein